MIPVEINPLGCSKLNNKNPLTFVAKAANSSISLSFDSGTILFNKNNNSSWSSYHSGEQIQLSNVGDTVSFKNISNFLSNARFTMSGVVSSSGDCMSLLNNSNSVPDHGFERLFYKCDSLLTPPAISATTIGSYGCYHMFHRCGSLLYAPNLPAINLNPWCYSWMFHSCKNLQYCPSILPATILYNGCYNSMFDENYSLINTPILPATTLVYYCYESMFKHCHSITSIELPATTLADSCYGVMLQDCNLLNHIKVKFTNWLSSAFTSIYGGWVEDVAQSGLFNKPPSLLTEYGINRIPNGWTVENYT